MPSDTNVLKFIRKCLPFARRRLHPGSAPALTTHATSTPPLAAEVIAAFRSSAEPDGGEFRSDLNVSRVLDAAIGAVYLRLLLGQSLGRSWFREMADTILYGCYADKSGQAQAAR